jgi:site-specific DNA-methyltransferase (adenine-specific)
MDFKDGCKLISDNSIDLLLTDPPYGINLTVQRKSSKFKNEKITNDNTLNWLPILVNEAYRVCKNAILIFCNWQNYDKFKQEFEKRFIIKNCLVWNKDWFGMGNNFRPNHEFIMLCCKTNVKTKSNNLSNILTFKRLHPSKLKHPTEKPVPLLELLIKELTHEKDLIADFFVGSGSTLEACINTNRNFIGFEIDKKYYNIANKRLQSIVFQ